MTNPKFKQFDNYSYPGDCRSVEVEPFTVTARIERDDGYHIDDDDTHNVDQSVTGCNNEQQAKLMAARRAWHADEWFYCGIVMSVQIGDVMLEEYAASLWQIECNYPGSDNAYLAEVAGELLDEALACGRRAFEVLWNRLKPHAIKQGLCREVIA